MGNTKKRIKRSKRVKMRKAKNTRKAKHTRKAKKKKTKQRGRGSPPDFPRLPEGNGCKYVESPGPGMNRPRRTEDDCNKTYGCEWGDKLSWRTPRRYKRCHKARLCGVTEGEGEEVFNVPCYLFNAPRTPPRRNSGRLDNERNKDLILKLKQKNLRRVF